MRYADPKPIKKERRNVQHMLYETSWLPVDGYDRLHDAFSVCLPHTKAWALATDFKKNVDEALEREKHK